MKYTDSGAVRSRFVAVLSAKCIICVLNGHLYTLLHLECEINGIPQNISFFRHISNPTDNGRYFALPHMKYLYEEVKVSHMDQ